MVDQLHLKIGRKPKTPDIIKITEHELMNWCISYLSLKGHFVQRINAGRSFVRDNTGKVIRTIMLAEKGTPDIVGFHGKTGKFIGIEVKVHPNVPSPAQYAFLEQLLNAGGIGAVIYSQEDLMQIL